MAFNIVACWLVSSKILKNHIIHVKNQTTHIMRKYQTRLFRIILKLSQRVREYLLIEIIKYNNFQKDKVSIHFIKKINFVSTVYKVGNNMIEQEIYIFIN